MAALDEPCAATSQAGGAVELTRLVVVEHAGQSQTCVPVELRRRAGNKVDLEYEFRPDVVGAKEGVLMLPCIVRAKGTAAAALQGVPQVSDGIKGLPGVLGRQDDVRDAKGQVAIDNAAADDGFAVALGSPVRAVDLRLHLANEARVVSPFAVPLHGESEELVRQQRRQRLGRFPAAAPAAGPSGWSGAAGSCC